MDFLLPVFNPLHSPGASCDRSQARRAGEAFLGAAINHVEAKSIHWDFHATQRGDRIDQNEHTCLVSRLGYVVQRLEHTRRGLGMDDAHDLGIGIVLDRLCHIFRVYGLAHGSGNGNYLRSATFRHVDHPGPEHAVGAYYDLVSSFNHIDAGRFHSSASGTRHGHRQLVFRLEDIPEQVPGFIHDGDKILVQVPQRRLRKCSQYPAFDGRRSRPE